jgi:hypothetical protein
MAKANNTARGGNPLKRAAFRLRLTTGRTSAAEPSEANIRTSRADAGDGVSGRATLPLSPTGMVEHAERSENGRTFALFISYARSEAASHARLLHARFEAELGEVRDPEMT